MYVLEFRFIRLFIMEGISRLQYMDPADCDFMDLQFAGTYLVSVHTKTATTLLQKANGEKGLKHLLHNWKWPRSFQFVNMPTYIKYQIIPTFIVYTMYVINTAIHLIRIAVRLINISVNRSSPYKLFQAQRLQTGKRIRTFKKMWIRQ
jgi:hypothetical protein